MSLANQRPVDTLWNKIPTLDDGENLDNFRKSGVFAVKDPYSAPTAGDYFLIAMDTALSGQRRGHQTLHCVDDGTTYTRERNVSGWTAWVSGGGGGGPTTGYASGDRVFNVLDYGAVRGDSDGSANRTAFENAIVACETAGGGTIYAPGGRYMINYGGSASVGGVRLRSNMALQGDGMGVTIIQCCDIGNNDLAGVVRTQSGIENSNIVVRDLTIDGNKSAQTGWANIICFYAGVTPADRVHMDRDIRCINVEVKNGKNGTTGSANLTRGYGFDPHEVVDRFLAIGCYAHDCERDGFVLDGVTNFKLMGCWSNDNGRYGFNIITECFNGLIQGCHADGNTSNNYMVQGNSHHIKIDGCFSFNAGEQGIRVRRGLTVVDTFCTITNNHVEGSARNGINLTGCAYNIAQDNFIIDSSQSATNTYMQVSLDEDDGDSGVFTGAANNIIKGNNAVAQTATANKAKAGYREDLTGADPNHNTYIFNQSEGHVQAKYLTLSATSRIIDSTPAFYNARDYGAVADGVTSDTTNIRALVDTVEAAGGGVVYVPAGVYALNGTGTASQGCIALPSNVTLLGDGPGKTVFKLLDQVNVSVTGIVRLLSGAANTNVEMIGFTIDGNLAAQTGTADITGIYTGGAGDTDVKIIDVEVKNCNNGTTNVGHGVRLKDTGTRFTLANVYSHDNDRDGFNIDTVTKVHMINCRAATNGRNGFDVTGASAVTMVDCVGEGNVNNFVVEGDAFDVRLNGGRCTGATNEGFRIKAGATISDTKVAIVGMLIDNNQRDGLKIGGGQNNRVTGCTFRDNGQQTNNTYPDISLLKDTTNTTPNADYNVIQANVFLATAANKTKYGVSETAAEADNNRFIWNTFRGHTTSSVNKNGAASVRYDETTIGGEIIGKQSVLANLPTYTDAAGVARPLGSDRMRTSWGEATPSPGATTISTLALAIAQVGTSTLSAASPANTDVSTASKRILNTGPAASTNNKAGVKSASRFLWRGNAARQGGFTWVGRWNRAAYVTNSRGFMGVIGSANDAVDNSSFAAAANWLDVFGVGFEGIAGNYHLYSNDASGAPTDTDLGANFPVAADDVYQLTLYCKPNDTVVYYLFENITTGNSTGGSVNTNLPSNNVFLSQQVAIGSTSDSTQSTFYFHRMAYEAPSQ